MAICKLRLDFFSPGLLFALIPYSLWQLTFPLFLCPTYSRSISRGASLHTEWARGGGGGLRICVVVRVVPDTRSARQISLSCS